jgi:hypothetical protein
MPDPNLSSFIWSVVDLRIAGPLDLRPFSVRCAA